MASRSRSASPPNSASKIRNTSPPCGCRTMMPAAIGRTRATTGFRGSKSRRLANQDWAPYFTRRPSMPTFNLLLLAGDGIGPEVMAEVKRLLGFYAKQGIAEFRIEEGSGRGGRYVGDKNS